MDKRVRQRKAAHRQRKAYGRARHQLLAFKNPWLAAFRRGGNPGRIRLPRLVRHRKRELYAAFTGVT